MKKFKFSKIIAGFMACVISFSVMGTVVVSAKTAETQTKVENIYKNGFPEVTESELLELTNEFNSRPYSNILTDWLLKGLKYIGGNIGKKVEGKAWGKIWDCIFGRDTRHQQIIRTLEEIQNKLDKINGMLTSIKDLIKEVDLKKQIQKQCDLIRTIELTTADTFRDFNASNKYTEKCKYLDKWYENSKTPEGSGNGLVLFGYFCNKITNSDNLNMDGLNYFKLYDKYAHVAWRWESQGYSFRQMQRERDLQTVIRLSALLMLWIQKDLNDPTKEKSVILGRAQTVKDRLEKDIIPLVEKKENQVVFRKDVNKFTFGNTSFDVHKTLPQMRLTDPLRNNLHNLSKRNDTDRKETHSTKKQSKNLVENRRKECKIDDKFELIKEKQLKELRQAADVENKSVYQLFQDGGFDFTYKTVLFATSEKNQPVYFAGYKRLAGTRNLHIRNADISKPGGKMWTDTFMGETKVTICDHDRFQEFKPAHGYYEATQISDNDTVKDFSFKDFTGIYTSKPAIPAF